MYFEDRFIPTYDEVIEDADSYISNEIINKPEIENIKKLDRGYHKLKRPFNKYWVDGKYYKNINIEFYKTGGIGNKIRNAITGEYYNSTVGSFEEDLYFSVIIATGETGQEQVTLFYDSPDQYEKHQFLTLSPNIKQRWHDKNIAARVKYITL
jgi:hypothetical protein